MGFAGGPNLFWELTKKEIKLRYKRSVLGFAWSLLNPILTMAIFTLVFSRFPRISDATVPYPLFFLSGYLPWVFFSQALSSAMMSIIANGSLVKQAAFPRWLLPAAAVCANLVNFAVTMLLFAALLAVWPSVDLNARILWAVPACGLLALFAFGLSLILSAANVSFRDVGQIFEVISTFWFYLTPVFYSFSIFTGSHPLIVWTLAANPMAHYIGLIRGAMIGAPGGPASWLYAAAAAAAALEIGRRFFVKRQDTLAKEL